MKFEECWDDANQKTKEEFKKAITHCFKDFGNKEWEELLGTEAGLPYSNEDKEAKKEPDPPIYVYEYMRETMKRAGYMSCSGFTAKFRLTDAFDRGTFNIAMDGSTFRRGVEGYYSRAYDHDGADYSSNHFLQHFIEHDTIAYNRFANQGYTEYRYYYRNELDHYLTHLLQMIKARTRIQSFQDFGLEIIRREISSNPWTPPQEKIIEELPIADEIKEALRNLGEV